MPDHSPDHSATPEQLPAIHRSTVESALDCIISMDAAGIVREFNPAAERTFGYRREEAIGRELAELIIPPELREHHRRGLARFLETGEGPVLGKRIEIEGWRSDQSRIRVELAINSSTVDGAPFFTAYLRDITERDRRDAALRRVASIVESSDDAIISIDLDMLITSWNGAAERLFGYEQAEVLGRPVTLLIPPDRYNEEPQILERIRRGERIQHYETIRRRKDGTPLNISLSVSPLNDGEGNVIGASKIARDITARVRTDRRRLAQYAVASLLAGSRNLDEASAPVLQTIASIGDWVFAALWLYNAEAQKLYCTRFWQVGSPALEAFGVACGSIYMPAGAGLPGRVWQQNRPVWIPDVLVDPNFPRAPHARAAGLRGAFAFPLFAERAPNGVIELLSHDIVEPDNDLLQFVTALGSQIGLFLERQRIEEELKEAKARAESASAAKDKFLAMLSHELRTPLTPVLMWAGGMVDQAGLDDEMRQGLRMVCRNVELEARLIDDMLDFTRISRGKLKLQVSHADVHELIRHALDIVRSGMPDRKVQAQMQLEAKCFFCTVDAPRLQQVFWNLFRNAYKFSPLDGEIVIRSFNPAPGRLVIEITDNGLGIQPDHLDKIFDAFEQVDPQREGLGLGLAISKAIVEIHGGKISARSEGRSKGATFLVDLVCDKSA